MARSAPTSKVTDNDRLCAGLRVGMPIVGLRVKRQLKAVLELLCDKDNRLDSYPRRDDVLRIEAY
jgi:hypothetical protein